MEWPVQNKLQNLKNIDLYPASENRSPTSTAEQPANVFDKREPSQLVRTVIVPLLHRDWKLFYVAIM